MIPSVTDLKRATRASSAQRITLDRLPPHSPEAEQGVLGCIMISPQDCLNEAIEEGLIPASFYDLRHQTIYETMLHMQEQLQQIDVITLQSALKDRGVLEQVGGIACLASLPDAVPSATNLGYYLGIVLDKYLLRKMIHLCTDSVSRIYEYEGTVDELLSEFESDCLKLRVTKRNSTNIKAVVDQALAKLEASYGKGSATTGMSTGLTDLDRLTDGMANGTTTVLAAFPGGGKSALAINIADHAAIDLGLPVGVFSLEMSAAALATRMLLSRSKIDRYDVRAGRVSEHDFTRLKDAAARIANSNLHLEDIDGISISQLRSAARRMKQQHDVKLIILDYLQLVQGETKKGGTREQEVASISSGIKGMAKELDLPVIALSQLTDNNGKPKLRDSAAIGQDADMVWMLEPGEHEDGANVIPVTLKVKKSREGSTGNVSLTFFKKYTRFESMSRVDDRDVQAPYRDE